MPASAVYEAQKEANAKVIAALAKDFSSLRSGKVNINVLDSVYVDYYGSQTPLNQVASIMSIDASTISVTPWEKNLLKNIDSAIAAANLGVNPNNDGECVKLFFPPMTKEQRQESVKQAKAMAEKAKVALRNARKDANDAVKKLEKDKELSEDEAKKAQAVVQKNTDAAVEQVETNLAAKEAALLKI